MGAQGDFKRCHHTQDALNTRLADAKKAGGVVFAFGVDGSGAAPWVCCFPPISRRRWRLVFAARAGPGVARRSPFVPQKWAQTLGRLPNPNPSPRVFLRPQKFTRPAHCAVSHQCCCFCAERPPSLWCRLLVEWSLCGSPLLSIRAAMGQYPTDEELLQMIAEVDDDGSNEIEFSEFLKAPLHPSPWRPQPPPTVTLTGPSSRESSPPCRVRVS